ncbi:MAG: IS1 family transposase [Ignavibacteriales bacterium]|nr:IS1 family transposase [Ignavibacteriales bacterium]
MANNLPAQQKALVLSLLSEGNSLRTISRVSGVARNTISKLLLDAGEMASEILDREMVNIQSRFIQVDEIWTFVGKKQKRVSDNDNPDFGDQYVFVALDADTKLVPVFRVGKRTSQLARSFLHDLNSRITTRFQLTSDSWHAYSDAVDTVFGTEIDYGQLHKQYREETKENQRRYSPAKIIGITKKVITGEPKRKHISTSYIERQNLTMRMQLRRFTRLTNAFSKSLKHLEAALALHFFHYNFMRLHETLRVTPAMEARISKHLWTWEEFLGWGRQEKQAA